MPNFIESKHSEFNNNESSCKASDWNYPTSIKFGNGRISELPQVCRDANILNPLIITDPSLTGFDFINEIKSSLDCCDIFSDIKPNPNGKNIQDGVLFFNQGQHDGIIAIGGGSALDAGKAIAFMAKQSLPIWQLEDVGDNWTLADSEKIITTIAIPTTAGTGSEVGRASVIVDESSQSKKIIFHPLMLPKYVILDPELTQDLPQHLTAATGMDAFVHCFEAYCAPGYHPMAEGIALQGMKLIKDWLPKAYHNGHDLEARGNMLTASTMGATAFQKGLGACHALAHPLGALYDSHHGLLNAILLPYVVKANSQVLESKIVFLCRYLSLEKVNKTDSDQQTFMAWLLALRDELKIPHTLAEIGIQRDDTVSKQFSIGELAFQDPSASGNPISLTVQGYQNLLHDAISGNLD